MLLQHLSINEKTKVSNTIGYQSALGFLLWSGNRVRDLEHDCLERLGFARTTAPTDSVRREMTRSYKDLRRFTLVLRYEGGKFGRVMFEVYWAS
jgi:hypothetical protein